MKSLKVLAALAIAAATFSACGNSTPKANLKTDVDSLSYAIGLAQSQYVRQAIQQGQVIDTTYMDEFV
ncbi:MAG TPA: peptidylprolyl isomerase, partial [Prevotella sp.]|nr:peptidylprolyl isomerase [Prevotella sp.]